MLLKLLPFELKQQVKQGGFWAATIALIWMAVLITSQRGSALLYANSAHAITQTLLFIAPNIIFVVCVLASATVLRDSQYNMEPLIFSTPIDKFKYLASRYFSITLAGALILFIALIAMMITPYFLAPELIGPYQLGFYLINYFIFVLPNVLLCTSVVFAAAMLSKSMITVFVSGIVIYVIYIIGSVLGNSPLMANSSSMLNDGHSFASLIEPYGLIAYMEQSAYWSAEQRNTFMPSLTGDLLFNRILWLAVSFSLFAFTYKTFTFRKTDEGHVKKDSVRVQAKDCVEANANQQRVIPYQSVSATMNFDQFNLSIALSKFNIEFFTVIKSKVFIVLMFTTVVFTLGNVVSSILGGPIANGQPFLAQTELILELLQAPLAKIGMLVVIFFSVELYWNDKLIKISPLVDCTPTKNFTFYIAKLITVLAIGFTLIAASIMTAIIFQFSQGVFDIQPRLYLLLFYFSGVPMLLTALLTFFLQRFANIKAIGLLLGLGVFILNSLAEHVFIEHPLTVFAYQPYFIFSQMADTIYHAQATHWYNAYWLSLMGVLGVLTVKFWQRGTSRVAQQLSIMGRVLLVCCALVCVGSGSYIFYQTNIFNQFTTKDQSLALMADYEREYRQYQTLANPTVINAKISMDIFPEQRRYQVQGNYVIKNQTSEPIEQVLVSVLRQSHVEYQVAIHDARLIEHDKTHQTMLFKLVTPLVPQATTTVNFNVSATHNAFSELDGEHYVTIGGSYIELEDVIPQFGYIDDYVLKDSEKRKELHLPKLTPTLPSKGMQVRLDDRLTFEAVISTSEDQMAVTVGKLKKQWLDSGRNYFHYQSDNRIKAQLAVVSGKFEVAKRIHNGVELRIYHHPEHYQSNEMIFTALTQTMDYFATHYKPYHEEYYSVIEIPYFSSLQSFGSAQPNMYVGVENRMFNLDNRQVDIAEFNPQLRGISHEFAHQYWGGYLEPHYIAGAAILTETLAKYTELVMLNAVYGENSAIDLVRQSLDVYLKVRPYMIDFEQPLYTMGYDPHLFYSKGQHSMHALIDILGEDKINQALKQLLTEKGYPNKATSLDLLSAFYYQATDEQTALIDDLFKHVVFHELAINSVVTTQVSNGQYKTTLKVSTLKHKLDPETNKEQQVPINDSIDIAIYSGFPAYDDSNVIAIKKVVFNQDQHTVEFYSDVKPTYAQIDPKLLRIDRNLANNLIEIH